MPRLGFHMRRVPFRRAGPPIGLVRPLTLADLPAGAIAIDFDPASGIVADATHRVSTWTAATGGVALAQAAALAQPLLGSWSSGVPCVTGDGSDDALTGPSLGLSHHWLTLVAERGATNTASTPTSRELLETGRSGDNLRIGLLGERPGVDTAQTRLKASSPGSGSSFTPVVGWPVGQRSVITVAVGPDGQALAIDGSAMTSRANAAGSTTASTTTLFGSSTGTVANQHMGGKVARLLAVDYDLLPGRREQQYNRFVIEALLARQYDLDKATWPATHPFKARHPHSADWTGNNRLIQLWGNSIGNYAASFYAPNFSYPFLAHGLTVTNGCVGGNTTTQIRDRFMAGHNTGTGTTDGLPVADQRRKLTIIGEFFQNGPSDTTGDVEARMRGELAEMVAAVEAAQDVAPGRARLMLWDSWISWSNLSQAGTGHRTTIDARNAWLASTYPNYLFRASEIARATSAPGSPHADATYHARQQPALALNRSGDATHPDDTLCNLIASAAVSWIEARRWDK